MKKNKAKLSWFLLSLFLLLLTFSLSPSYPAYADEAGRPLSFKALVEEVLKEEIRPEENADDLKQQNLRLRAISGETKGREYIYYGISEVEVADSKVYHAGDKVFVDVFTLTDGQEKVYVTEYDRSFSIYILLALFIATYIIIGRFKGFRSLLSLLATFIIILKFILPQILLGHDPFLISLIGGLLIMMAIIYLTEGWHRRSHLGILSVLFSLLATLLLSILFTRLTRLTGMAQEEVIFLIDLAQVKINFQGLLLAGMLIGAIGVLDDIIVGQIETVYRLKQANPNLTNKQISRLAYKIGNTHLGTMVNTLFLTYAGAALPLLLIFSLGASSGLGLGRNLNSELITTEIVRTLVGSIGVMLAMPISTFLGTYGIKKVDRGEGISYN